MAAFAGGHMQTITNYFAENFGGKRATLRHLRNLAAYVAGRFSRHERLDATRIERLVFVCKGNICRSAYAHAVASARGLRAASFGLDTPGDEPADPVAARNALARGVSLATHRTSSSRSFALEPTDLLVVMEPEQAQELELLEGRHQVTLLGLWSKPRRPFIQDPYGRSDEYFQTCFGLIDSGVHGLERLLKSATTISTR